MIYGHIGTTRVPSANDRYVPFGTGSNIGRGYIIVTGVVYGNRFFGVAGGVAVLIPAVFISDDGDVNPLGIADEGMYRVSVVVLEETGRQGTGDGFRRGARVRSGEHGHRAFPVSA